MADLRVLWFVYELPTDAGNVELVQDRTVQLLQEQERDLLRAFRARLFDIQVSPQ